MTSYYNEIEPFAIEWLKKLIDAGRIPRGDIDNRPIQEVKPNDVKGYTQCHFFAGIAGWAYALELARIPTTIPIWTGSCPCQPFSSAGKRKGQKDERHLWPYWYRLIRECNPPVIFGEQVESAVAFGWLDETFDDLEGEGYACGAAILPACSVGAPHRRNRLWFVADSRFKSSWAEESGLGKEREYGYTKGIPTAKGDRPSNSRLVGHAEHDGSFSPKITRGDASTSNERCQKGQDSAIELTGASEPSNVADTAQQGSRGHREFNKSINETN